MQPAINHSSASFSISQQSFNYQSNEQSTRSPANGDEKALASPTESTVVSKTVSYSESSYSVSIGKGYQYSSLTYQKTSISSQSFAVDPNVNQAKTLTLAGDDSGATDVSVNTSTAPATANAASNVDKVDAPTQISSGAENILTYIDRYISSAADNGASEEELDELLQQGLSGFEKGYAEAEQILSDLAQLTDVVQPAINTLYNEVVDGVQQLRSKYLGAPASAEPSNNDKADANIISSNKTSLNITGGDPSSVVGKVADKPIPQQEAIDNKPQQASVASESQPSINAAPKEQPVAPVIEKPVSRVVQPEQLAVRKIFSNNQATQTSASLVQELSSFTPKFANVDKASDVGNSDVKPVQNSTYERSQSFDFTLTTQEGDTVTIKADSNFYESFNFDALRQNDEDGNVINNAETTAIDSGNFSVEGDLDEGEVAAIKDLLKQVTDLADEFYYGDVGKAYEAALETGFDATEIASYALSLEVIETQTINSPSIPVVDDSPVINNNADTNVAKALTDGISDLLSNEFQFLEKFAQNILQQNDETVGGLFEEGDLLNAASQQIDNTLANAVAEQAGLSFFDAISSITGAITRNHSIS